MKTIYLLPFSILTVTSLVAQNVEPTHKHVSYGPHKDMKLNFWKIEAKEPTPLLVHIHGGGWLGGKKNETIAPTFSSKGTVIAPLIIGLQVRNFSLPPFMMLPGPFNFFVPRPRSGTLTHPASR